VAQKDLLDLLRKIGEGRAAPSEWAQRQKALARIDLSNADLSELDLRAIDLPRADLTAANLYRTHLSSADLSDAALIYADLRLANLSHARLAGANLSGANLEGAALLNADLRHALVQKTRLTGAYLVGAAFDQADLDGADLRGANCKFASFVDTRMHKVNLDGADLAQTELSPEQLRAVRTSETRALVTSRSKRRARSKAAASETHDDLFTETDSYTVLGLEPGATMEDVTHAYRRRAKEYHPDRVNHLGAKLQEVARREFLRVQQAYESVTHHLARTYVEIESETGLRAEDVLLMRQPRSITLEQYMDLAMRYPMSDCIQYNLGVKLFDEGLLEQAIQAFLRAIQINPRNESAQYNLKILKLLQQLLA
jgi:DnaJ-domain-containing protein 1